jgi:peptide/nickel transport system ATP-binding protein
VGGTRCADESPLLSPGRGAACHLTAEQKQTIFIEQIKPRLR